MFLTIFLTSDQGLHFRILFGPLCGHLDALGRLLRPLGDNLEGLGRLWASLGRLLRPLGDHLEALGRFWASLGRLLRSLGDHLEALGRPPLGGFVHSFGAISSVWSKRNGNKGGRRVW